MKTPEDRVEPLRHSALTGLRATDRAEALRLHVEMSRRAEVDPTFRAALILTLAGQLIRTGSTQLAASLKVALYRKPSKISAYR